jgi:hypothetical protein
VDATLVERFGTGEQSGEQIVDQLTPAGRVALRAWLRTLSPVGQFTTRHSRETLKLYRAQGLLSENLADRDVKPRVIPFDGEEQRLYKELDELIDRLMAAHGSSRGAGFVLTVYRRRLTSSWSAIRKTLTRRLNRETLRLDDDFLEEAEDAALDTGLGGTVDDTQAVPLTRRRDRGDPQLRRPHGHRRGFEVREPAPRSGRGAQRQPLDHRVHPVRGHPR